MKKIALVAFLFVILFSVLSLNLASCNEETVDTKKSFYKEDGSLDYEEFYDENGVLEKMVCYYFEVIEKTETYYDKSGLATKEYIYHNDFYAIEEFDRNENITKYTQYEKADDSIIMYTVFEYDENQNMIKETVFNSDGSVESKYDFEYNEYGAMMKETRTNRAGGKTVVEYSPINREEKHEHFFAFSKGMFCTGSYEHKIQNGATAGFDYIRINYYATYRADGSLGYELARVYDESGDYKIRRTTYEEDGSIKIETFLDKNGAPLRTDE